MKPNAALPIYVKNNYKNCKFAVENVMTVKKINATTSYGRTGLLWMNLPAASRGELDPVRD
jgi:hypothetical protein